MSRRTDTYAIQSALKRMDNSMFTIARGMNMFVLNWNPASSHGFPLDLAQIQGLIVLVIMPRQKTSLSELGAVGPHNGEATIQPASRSGKSTFKLPKRASNPPKPKKQCVFIRFCYVSQIARSINFRCPRHPKWHQVTPKCPQGPSKTSQNGRQEHPNWPLSPLTLVHGTQWHPMWTQ